MILVAKIKLILILFFLLNSCLDKKSIILIDGKTMGTTYRVKYYRGDKNIEENKVKKEIDHLLIEVNRQMNTYQKDSEISLFNNQKRIKKITISKDFFNVLDYSLKIAKETKGAFDPTIGPLVNLWGFGPNGKRKVPSKQNVLITRQWVGYQQLKIFPKTKQIRKMNIHLSLDLSATAKGFAVDKIAHYLELNDVKNYLVEIGGEIRTSGRKNKALWLVAIEVPNFETNDRSYDKILKLNNQSIATSGSYRNFFLSDGNLFSHGIDQKTGQPIHHNLISVTVIFNSKNNQWSCLNADAWATAFMIMGFKKAYALAEKKGIKAYFIFKKDSQLLSKGTSNFNKYYGMGNG